MTRCRLSSARLTLPGLLLLGMALGCGPQSPPLNAAVKVAITAAPQGGTAGVALSTLEVTLQDAQGATVSGARDSVRLTLATGPTGAVLKGTASVQAVNGVARFTDLVLERAGRYTLAVSAGTLESATSAAFDVAPAAAASFELTQLVPTVAAGTAASVQITARDAFGNVATHYTGTVSFSSTDDTASLPPAYSFTVADAGRHTFTDSVTLKKAGSQQVRVTDAANASLTASQQVTVLAGAASRLVFTRQPANRSVRATLLPVEVSIVDSLGNTVDTSSPPISLSISQAGVTLEGQTSLSPSAGVASFTSLSIAKENTDYTLTASAANISSATSAPFNIIDDVSPARPVLSAGTVTDLQATVSWTAVGDDDTQGTASEYELRYATTDIVSEADFAAATRVTTNVPQVTGTAEQVTLNGLTPGTTYYVALKVTDNVGNSSRSATLQLTTQAAAAFRLAFLEQPPNGTAGTALSTFRVAIQDATGATQTTSGTTVTLTLQGASGFGPFTAVTVNGVATFDTVRVDQAGTGYTLTADANGATSAISQAFAISPATPWRLRFSTPVNTYKAGTIIPLEVSVRDAYGNLTPSYTSSIVFTHGDPDGDVPVEYEFTAGDAGRHTFNMILRTPGEQTVGASDLFNGTISGSIVLTITAP